MCVFPVGDAYFRSGIWVFLFSGTVFLFWVSHFVLCVSVSDLFSPIFVVVVVVVLWFFLFLSATLYI